MLGLVNQDSIYLVSKLGSIQLKPVDKEELIESKKWVSAISISRKFMLRPAGFAQELVSLPFPVFPSEQLESQDDKPLPYATDFTLKNRFKPAFLDIRHISGYLNEISLDAQCTDRTCTFIAILANTAVVIVKRLEDFLYFNIFEFEESPELLYYIAAVFEQLNLDRENARLVMMGEIREGSQLYNQFKIYFRNLHVDESNFFSRFSSN
ncbi:MAG: DUF3822 family protein [Saprospiraceae bacterium]|nr:DUF3822 family protein [Candidatus Vicinibacter affinis]MBP6173827.1 DUF3822 family protein [Saprospiraceae bacterium]MBK6572556.1 DUF3822 family protein [Candidatus Vicinibacter affinis]MBK6825368.1 DUF3822 family protein [Candidatus Vicinibacter affinis]MBK7303091.1 DUF3822 family protein [Candidatus Vicinibacter affinis]